MVRKELIRQIVSLMRDRGLCKQISIPKHVFHISDDEGNKKDFSVKKKDQSVPYTYEDIEAVLDACQYVIQEAMKAGDEISIRGFGTLGLKYRKPRLAKNVLDGEMILMEGHYVPKFVSGNDLRRCAQMYEQSIADKKLRAPMPIFQEDQEADD